MSSSAWIVRLHIGTRLALGFGLVLLFSSILLVLGLWGMRSLQHTADDLLDSKVAGLNAATQMREHARVFAVVLQRLSAPLSMEELEKDKQQFRQVVSDYHRAAELLTQLYQKNAQDLGQSNTDLHQQTVLQAERVLRFGDMIYKLVSEGESFEAQSLLKADFGQPHAIWIARLSALADAHYVAMKHSQDSANINYQRMSQVMLGLGIVLLSVSALAAWLITRSILIPLREACQIADGIAGGQLCMPIEIRSRDELAALLNSLAQMQGNLRQAVVQIQHSSSAVQTGSKEIALRNAQFVERSSAQAAALHSTNNSMQSLTSTVEQNDQSARRANQQVLSACDVAQRGGTLVEDVVVTMQAIAASSRQIVEIISVIDGIAFQTNILALNAAVEAARAGEQGRGFGVVAAEVRNLAQRSASAAQDIKILINDSVGKIAQGGSLVANAGATMQEVVSSVQHVVALMSEIVAASAQQNEGIHDIHLALDHMQSLIHENAALVQSSSTEAALLEAQALQLARMANAFIT